MEFVTIAIIMLLVIGAFTLLRMKHFKHKITIAIIICLVLFFYFTAPSLTGDVNLKTVEGIEYTIKVYFAWFGNAFQNFRTLTGQAVGMDWSPKNKTSSGG